MGREKRQMGKMRGGQCRKNLIECDNLSLSETPGCEKSRQFVIIQKQISFGGCHAKRL